MTTLGPAGPGEPGRHHGHTEEFAPVGADAPGDVYRGVAPPILEEELAGLRGKLPPQPKMPRAGRSPRTLLPLEEEPSEMIAKYLFPTEKFRGEWRRHWVQLIKEALIGAGATLALGLVTGYTAAHDLAGLTTIVILLWAGVMGWVVWQVADWYNDRFILTNKRVMVVHGLITRNVGMMPLGRVTDMKYVQSPMGRALNYGTFVLESAGQDQALSKVANLPNPNELYLRIVEEMYEPEAVEARLGQAAEEAQIDDGT